MRSSIEAYWANSTSGKYNEIYSLFNGVYVSSWKKAGYTSHGYSLQTIYDGLKRGPVIIQRIKGENSHFSVIVAYEGSNTSLEMSGFKVMEVQRYNRTDGSYGYPSKWNSNYSNATKVPLDIWKSDYSLTQVCTRDEGGEIYHNPVGVVEVISGGEGYITIGGWTKDDDSPNDPLTIHVYVGGPAGSGVPCYVFSADKYRSDVGNHGFSETIPIDQCGNINVYIYAINAGSGTDNPLIGAGTATVTADITKPVIKNVYVKEYDKDGYTVVAEAEDNVGIQRVRFPTKTEGNDNWHWY